MSEKETLGKKGDSVDQVLECLWQRGSGPKQFFVAYKWVNAFIFVSLAIFSISGVEETRGFSSKCLLYVTYWCLVLGALQSCIGAIALTASHRKFRRGEPYINKRLFESYYSLKGLVTGTTFQITSSFWVLEFPNLQAHEVDLTAILVHSLNTFLLFTDLILNKYPFRMIYSFHCILFFSVYTIFNYIYCALGGTDREGNNFIYKFMNWNESLGESLYFLLGSSILVTVHVAVAWVISFLARKMASNLCQKEELKSLI